MGVCTLQVQIGLQFPWAFKYSVTVYFIKCSCYAVMEYVNAKNIMLLMTIEIKQIILYYLCSMYYSNPLHNVFLCSKKNAPCVKTTLQNDIKRYQKTTLCKSLQYKNYTVQGKWVHFLKHTMSKQTLCKTTLCKGLQYWKPLVIPLHFSREIDYFR